MIYAYVKELSYLIYLLPFLGMGQIVSLDNQLFFKNSSTNELHDGIVIRYLNESQHIYNGEEHIKVRENPGKAAFSLYTEFFFDGNGNKFVWIYNKESSDKEKDIFDSPDGDRFIFFHKSKDFWHLKEYIPNKNTYKYIRVFSDMKNFEWMDSDESNADKISKSLAEKFTKPSPISIDSKTYKAIDLPFRDYIQRKIEKLSNGTGLGSEYTDGRTTYLVDVNSDSKKDIMILYTLEAVGGGMNWTRNLIFLLNGTPHFSEDFDTTLFDKIGDPGEFLGMRDGWAVFKFTDRFENGEYILKGYGIRGNKLVTKDISRP